MARNGSGVMSIPNPNFVAGTTIVSGEVDANFSTITDEITNSIAADGQTTPTANLPMGGFKLTGLGSATAATDSVHLRDVQYQAWSWGGTAAGTADALTLSPSPAIGAYAAGQRFIFQAGVGDNTGAATLNISALGTKAIQNNGSALAGGDIKANDFYAVVYDGTQFQLTWHGSPSDFARTILDDASASAVRNTLELNGRTVYAGTVAGTADAVALTTGLSLSTLTNGDLFYFFAGGTNTTNVTVNVDSIGATAVNSHGDPLAAGAIVTGDFVLIGYDGTDFELVYPRRHISVDFTIVNDGAGATNPGKLTLYNNSVSPALFDAVGRIDFAGNDSAGNMQNYALIFSQINDPTSTSEDGRLFLQTIQGGTAATVLSLGPGVIVGSATGGDKGADSVNASDFYRDGVLMGGTLIAVIEDQKTSGTGGGTFTSGADQVRDLNTEVFDLANVVSVAANQITLAAGDYIIKWSAPAFRVTNHQSLLRDVTGTADVARGSTERAGSASTDGMTASTGVARVTPSGSNVYEIRHRGTTSIASEGFGQAASFGTEVYTRVEIYAV